MPRHYKASGNRSEYLDYYKTLEPAGRARLRDQIAREEADSRRKAEALKSREEARLKALGRSVIAPPHRCK